MFLSLGSEFMPAPLDEGTILYMPTIMPGISVGQAERLLQTTDLVLKQFPEVDPGPRKSGKGGKQLPIRHRFPCWRLSLPSSPRSEWRRVPTWYSQWTPDWTKAFLARHITPDTISIEELVSQMDAAVKAPGVEQW